MIDYSFGSVNEYLKLNKKEKNVHNYIPYINKKKNMKVLVQRLVKIYHEIFTIISCHFLIDNHMNSLIYHIINQQHTLQS